MPQVAICDGYIVPVISGPLSPFVCSATEGVVEVSGTWVIDDQPLPFELSQLDPTLVMGMFMVGFMFYAIPFMIGAHVGGLVKFFRDN